MKSDSFYKKLLDNLYDGVYFVDLDRKITYWNKSAETLTGYRSAEIVGRHCWNNILTHVDGRGRNLCSGECPLVVCMREDRTLEQEVFLRHKDGYRVPVMVRASPIKNERGQIIGSVEIFSDNSSRIALAHKVEELQTLAMLDPLTELGNRRYAELMLQTRLDELSRYGWRFGLLFMDIDNFKKINDAYGHDIGDKVLRMVAKTVKNGVRSSDAVCRWGGEEFIGLISNIDEVSLRLLADKLRVLAEQSNLFSAGTSINATISVGATISRMDDTAETLIKRADSLMYQGKLSGRNCVVMD